MLLYIANWGLVLAPWLWELGDDPVSLFALVRAKSQKIPDEDDISGLFFVAVLLLGVF